MHCNVLRCMRKTRVRTMRNLKSAYMALMRLYIPLAALLLESFVWDFIHVLVCSEAWTPTDSLKMQKAGLHPNRHF